MKKKKCYSFWVALTVVVLTACANTRKFSVETIYQDYDSVSIARVENAAFHNGNRDSISVTLTDSARLLTSASETEFVEEYVNEHVMELVDSAGHKTTTTDRTIHRKSTTDKQGTATNIQWSEQVQTALYLSMLDSIVNSRQSDIGTHWSAKDSTYQAQKKDTTATLSFWAWIRPRLGIIICFVAFVAFATYAWNTRD